MTRTEFNAEAFATLQQLRHHGSKDEVAYLRRELIRRNVGLAKIIGRKFETIFKIRDARLLAFRLLAAAVDRYHPGCGRKFTTVAARRMTRAFYEIYQRQIERNAARSEAYEIDDPNHLGEMLTGLHAFEASIIARRFGLNGGGQRSLRDIGVELGLSAERVRQYVTRALAKMRRIAERDSCCLKTWNPRTEINE